MAYKRIESFPDTTRFDFQELRALSSVWFERKTELEGTGAYAEFIKKMQREWAIETGIIERLYTWDRGVTEILIDQGIDASIIVHKGNVAPDQADHIKTLINDHLDIVEGLFAYIKGDEPLTEHFIRNLQAKFTANQEFTEALTPSGDIVSVRLKRGEYKTLPNNPRRQSGEVHIYSPPEFTGEEMQNLVSMYREAERKIDPEIRAAWLHHRFTQIHPFQDGNGRVARALASLVFLKNGLFPLVIRDSDRKEYIHSLEVADDGDLSPLINLFARRQREAVLKAIGIEQQVQQSKYSDQIIASAMKVLANKFSKEQKKIDQVYEFGQELFLTAVERFREVCKSMDPQIKAVTPPNQEKYFVRSNSASNNDTKRHYFQKQIVTIANHFGYYANLETYRTWVRLTITTGATFDYVLSIHGYGPGATGLLAISAFTYIKAPKEEGGSEPISLHPASTDLFQFNYIEPIESTKSRFAEWIESSLAIALAEWKRTLS